MQIFFIMGEEDNKTYKCAQKIQCLENSLNIKNNVL